MMAEWIALTMYQFFRWLNWYIVGAYGSVSGMVYDTG